MAVPLVVVLLAGLPGDVAEAETATDGLPQTAASQQVFDFYEYLVEGVGKQPPEKATELCTSRLGLLKCQALEVSEVNRYRPKGFPPAPVQISLVLREVLIWADDSGRFVAASHSRSGPPAAVPPAQFRRYRHEFRHALPRELSKNLEVEAQGDEERYFAPVELTSSFASLDEIRYLLGAEVANGPAGLVVFGYPVVGGEVTDEEIAMFGAGPE